jgi:hypothetical protein
MRQCPDELPPFLSFNPFKAPYRARRPNSHKGLGASAPLRENPPRSNSFKPFKGPYRARRHNSPKGLGASAPLRESPPRSNSVTHPARSRTG